MIITPLSMTWILSQFSDRNSEIYFPGAPFIASAVLLTICISVFLFGHQKVCKSITLRIDEIELNVIN